VVVDVRRSRTQEGRRRQATGHPHNNITTEIVLDRNVVVDLQVEWASRHARLEAWLDRERYLAKLGISRRRDPNRWPR
jgi:hypothetical protein